MLVMPSVPQSRTVSWVALPEKIPMGNSLHECVELIIKFADAKACALWNMHVIQKYTAHVAGSGTMLSHSYHTVHYQEPSCKTSMKISGNNRDMNTNLRGMC